MAQVFMDTSALVRRYDRAEPGAQRVRQLCRRSVGHHLLIAQITPVEMAAALNRKGREGRFSPQEIARLWRLFNAHWVDRYYVTALDETAYRLAVDLTFRHPLRGYDAVQLATALRVRQATVRSGTGLRFCTADRRLAVAATAEGLIVELIQ